MIEIILKIIGTFILVLLGGIEISCAMDFLNEKKYNQFGMSIMFTVVCIAFIFKFIL
jgi:hypothetical protein